MGKYLALLIVVVVGVAGGNLLSDWITSRILAYRVQQAMTESSQSGRGGSARSDDANRTKVPMPGELFRMQQEQALEQRRRDRDGVRLGQACEEWRRADAQLNSDTTQAEMKKHCGIYERYVKDGVLPGKR